MRKPRWLTPRQGWVTPTIAVFVDEQENGMFIDKPVEVKVDARAKVVYVWTKVPGYKVQTEPIGGALDGMVLDDGINLPPWPDTEE